MKTSIFLKQVLSTVFLSSRVVDKRICQFWAKGFFPILMYHRVVPVSKLVQAGMYVAPETFEKHLVFLKKYFNIIPLSTLTVKSALDGIIQNGKPPCVLTFDDGWKDFYDYAFPLLVKCRQPATVFLPTGFIGSGKQFWTDSFAYLLFNRGKTRMERLSKPEHLEIIKFLNGLAGSFENQLESGIEYLKKHPLNKIEGVLVGLSEIWSVDLGESGRDFLNWSEIDEMVESGLVSFGSHTVNHQILTTLDNTAIKKELVDSQKELLKRNVVDSSFIPFCYPNGNYSEEIVDMVRSSGYHLAVTTKKGWNHRDADKFTLKRVAIHEDMSSTTALFASKIAGFI